MSKYLEIPRVVDVYPFNGEVDPVIAWKRSFPGYDAKKQPMSPYCGHGLSIGNPVTNPGEVELLAWAGDYIIRHPDGVFSVCSETEFETRYQAAPEPPKQGGFPLYVNIKTAENDHPIALRLNVVSQGFGEEDKITYFRDAGYWEVEFKKVGGHLYSVSHMTHLNGFILTPITHEEWRENNKGYV